MFKWLVVGSTLATPALANTTAHDAIKAQQGCFKVTFQYEEVKAHQDDYELAPPKTSSVIEWVSVDVDGANEIVLQHVLVTPPMIKHWKQIWTYERTEFDVYTAPDQWERTKLSGETAAGAWVQEVRGVADNPRYSCSAPWSLEDPEASWTCETWAAKPRRDKDRDDYDVLARTNTHRILSDGWVHEQRNTKVRFRDGKVQPIVTEQGHNTYERIDDSECAEAADWWQKRTDSWQQVQRAWNDVSGEYQSYQVDPKRGLFPLWIRLFWIARRPVSESKYGRLYAKANRIIARHTQEAASTKVDVPHTAPVDVK